MCKKLPVKFMNSIFQTVLFLKRYSEREKMDLIKKFYLLLQVKLGSGSALIFKVGSRSASNRDGSATWPKTIEEGQNLKTRQRSSRKICSIPCRAWCFALVDLEKKKEFNLIFQIDQGKTASAAKNLTNSACPANRRDDLCIVFQIRHFSIYLFLCPKHCRKRIPSVNVVFVYSRKWR